MNLVPTAELQVGTVLDVGKEFSWTGLLRIDEVERRGYLWAFWCTQADSWGQTFGREASVYVTSFSDDSLAVWDGA